MKAEKKLINIGKMKQPLISVVMPVYNAGPFLAEAIESILSQTYQNFEFIIIDDASIDNSLSIIRDYQKRYPEKIRIIENKSNLNCGGDKCANKGLRIAQGKYIARMDADDIAHSERLEKQVDFLEKNANVFLVGANAYVIDKKGNKIGEKLEPLNHRDIEKTYFTFNPLIHPACTYRRSIKNKKFLYQIKYNANNDYYTFFKLLCKGYKFANLKEKLLYFRIHGKNDTFVNMKQKYWNTLGTRMIMMFNFGYKPTIKDLITSFVQTIIILLLPEKLLMNIYLFAKGIKRF